ncbi:MAG: hypothetical protein A3I05_03700 [Deltaproteobacteria bacterium RIFCSPLOWO2_02_FULL_44_10]|nr:MAG: hypothetical protein A3C46_02765 [Deltaproteobacteria bacterium RIFCSPHIGHO2_02_FULL_44_16]OGQ47697.1 MAG: hypothetical protein A3I05_03700 [Deltaproteobacteria bacterium RIFCSPLOWO2_02_FULL_44_10]
MTLTLKSNGFDANGLIPQKFTCDGKDISPELEWSGVPAGTKSLALIVDDPDAPMGTWDHWLLFNIPMNVTKFSEGMKARPLGTIEGKNSWNRTGYGGPCPPDREHRYFFKLYALDTTLSLKTGATKKEIEKAMQGHILAQTELIGRYDRPRR